MSSTYCDALWLLRSAAQVVALSCRGNSDPGIACSHAPYTSCSQLLVEVPLPRAQQEVPLLRALLVEVLLPRVPLVEVTLLHCLLSFSREQMPLQIVPDHGPYPRSQLVHDHGLCHEQELHLVLTEHHYHLEVEQ